MASAFSGGNRSCCGQAVAGLEMRVVPDILPNEQKKLGWEEPKGSFLVGTETAKTSRNVSPGSSERFARGRIHSSGNTLVNSAAIPTAQEPKHGFLRRSTKNTAEKWYRAPRGYAAV